MEFDAIYSMALGIAPWLGWVTMILGSLVLIGIVVDKAIPDAKDGGFMTKVLGIPVLGALLRWTTKFSPFNVKA